MKLTDRELQELKYHYVDRVVENMSTKDLVQYVFDDMLRYVDTIFEVLEGAVDKYYNKLEAAKKKQPKAEW